MRTPVVPVLPDRYCRAWPKYPSGATAKYEPLGSALCRTFPTDAHFGAYSVPSCARRLSRGALREPGALAQLPDGVAMVAIVFDVDCSAAHGGAIDAIESWWSTERKKVNDLLVSHHGGFVYRTRRGYRLVYVPAAPVALHVDRESCAWSEAYRGWVAYLARRFGIEADLACRDWTRLFRLPGATRDRGGHPERLETIGDPASIGVWNCPALEATPTPDRDRHGPDAPVEGTARRWRSAPVPSGFVTTYGGAALRKAAAEVAGSPVGGRNAALNRAAYSLGRLVAAGHLNASDVAQALASAAEENGYFADTGEVGVLQVIELGLTAGVAAGPRGPTLPWAKRLEVVR